MSECVIAVFRSSREAAFAKQGLRASGFQDDAIREQSAAVAAVERALGEIRGLGWKMFGPGEHPAAGYADAIAQGHSVLAVEAANESEARRARFLMQRAGALDIRSRAREQQIPNFTRFRRRAAAPRTPRAPQVSSKARQAGNAAHQRWYRRSGELVKAAYANFSTHTGASRGAAIAFYTVTSMAPILIIVVAVAGFFFGRDAASGAIFEQFRGLIGPDGADLLQKALASASKPGAGLAASAVSLVTLILSASGVFLELEDALNAMWGAKAQKGLWSMARARIASLGLVIALGFVLIVSLVIDASLKGFGSFFPLGSTVLLAVSFAVSIGLMAVLIAGMFKYLPAKPIAWRDVWLGAAITAILFEIGKFLIGLYIGTSGTASSLGAAGALLALLVWVYYTAQIFLFGAAFTKVYAEKSPSSAPTTVAPRADSRVILHEPGIHRPRAAITFAGLAAFLVVEAIARRIARKPQHRPG